jgi:hypothetical protein
VGHYNYEGMKKIGIRFFESYINATLIEWFIELYF